MTERQKLLLFVAALFLSILLAFADDVWDRHLVLDHKGNFHVYWTPKEKRIIFKVEAAARGYLGFGLSPHGGMTGSDIVTGWVADGKAYFQDRHGVGNAFPPKDNSQDWVLSRGWENDTHTSLVFYRDLVTCDPDDMEIDGNVVRLIYAYSHNDPISEDSLEYHGSSRGARSAILLQGKMNHLKHLEELPYWDIKAPNSTLTSRDRWMYWNSVHKSPLLKVKHHIIKIEPLVQRNDELYVHHMNVFECNGVVPEEMEKYMDHPLGKRSNETLSESLQRCMTVLVSWNVGGSGIVLPDQAGFPLPAKTSKYYRLEIHYDNPFLHNIRDESGFRIYYTPKLRKHDAGILGIVVTPSPTLFIPPHQNEFIMAGHSSQECIAQKMPPSGIKIWAVQLHAHKLGRRIRLRHFRGNQELPLIADERNYDFNYQDSKYLEKEVHFLPSDQITIECFYNSSEKAEITFGGPTTNDEMCDSSVFYYPRIEKSINLSGAPLSFVANLLGAPEDLINSTSGISEKTAESNVKEYMNTIDWKSLNISKIQNSTRFLLKEAKCCPGNKQERFQKMEKMVRYPENLVPYYEKKPICSQKPKKGVVH